MPGLYRRQDSGDDNNLPEDIDTIPLPSSPQADLRQPIIIADAPSVHVQSGRVLIGGSQGRSTRSYTPLKMIGDGCFGTVWLCDWHSALPPDTPPPVMQLTREEYISKRLVAIKRLKKIYEIGNQRLSEIETLRQIPVHQNVISLYDAFSLPSLNEIYLVFEPMEGTLYQLLKVRKGKPFAGGLVTSIFHQVVQGLHHVHTSGYFHRDLKPENILISTFGLFEYQPVISGASVDATEPDVLVLVKLADFDGARETTSRPPYTEYVAWRWYRSPEILVRSPTYSAPADMWALGTVMAEVINLQPLFPGSDEFDQLERITTLLGDPVEDYGLDEAGNPRGGGQWLEGAGLFNTNYGMQFVRKQPQDLHTAFLHGVHPQLMTCIANLLRYPPENRLTSEECLHHPFLQETLPLNHLPPIPTQPVPAATQYSGDRP